jgi:outer membrane protein TolC
MIRARILIALLLSAAATVAAGDAQVAAGAALEGASVVSGAGAFQAVNPLTLEQVLGAALDRVSLEDARVGLAYGQLHYLKSQRKWKIQLRPNLGMLAFSSPALLAVNIGTGLLAHRQGRPDRQALRTAEFDVLSSEVANERKRLETRVVTAHVFFALLERQQDEDRVRILLDNRTRGRERMDHMLKASRVTIQDHTLFEAGLTDVEMQLVEAEGQRHAAAIELARLIGYAGRAQDLRVTDENMPDEWQQASLDLGPLVELAMARRGELKLLREKLDELPPGPSIDSKFRLDQLHAGYSYITDSVGSQLGMNPEGFILGGHTGRTGLGFAINLRDTGEKQASAEINAARRRVLELELRAAAVEVRMEVETVWHLHHASRRRLELAAKRQDLLASMLNTVKMRAEHGLATPVSVLTAEMEVLRQDSAYSEALSDRRTREFHLMAVCGVEEDGNLMAQNQTNGGGKSHDD